MILFHAVRQAHLDDATYEKYANELGLNMNKFKAALGDSKIDSDIKEDMAVASRFGAVGYFGRQSAPACGQVA